MPNSQEKSNILANRNGKRTPFISTTGQRSDLLSVPDKLHLPSINSQATFERVGKDTISANSQNRAKGSSHSKIPPRKSVAD